jgi:hypothetical protein
MDIRTLTIKERERLAYIKGHPDAGLLGEILAAQEERDAMETLFESVEDDLADALDRLGAQ